METEVLERSRRITQAGHDRTEVQPATPVDARRLERLLRERTTAEVRFDDGSRAMYATDASNYRQVPIGVVIPRTVEDVVQAVAVCHELGAPVLSRGGGTSLAGQCCNVAVMIDFSKYLNRVIELDPERRRARVQPGCILDTLRDEAAKHNLTFGPDPATHNHNTLGGMIGNNSCGVHSVLAEFYGPGPRTEDSIEELEVLTYDGHRLRVGPTPDDELDRIIDGGDARAVIYAQLRALRDRYADQIRAGFPKILRRVSGLNLPALLPEEGFNVARALVGSESSCVTVLEATVTLMPMRPCRVLVALGYPTVFDAGDAVPFVREFKPVALEGMDENLVIDMKKKNIHPDAIKALPPGKGWLLVEFGATTSEEAMKSADEFRRAISGRPNAPAVQLLDRREEEKKIWEVREAGLGATAFIPGEADTWPGWEDSAVPVDKVGPYLRDFRALLDRYKLECALYGHFGQGCIHCRISFDLVTEEGIENYRRFTHDAAELVSRKYGGSLSGEHGDGQARADLLPIMFGDELVRAFEEFKNIWDPDWKMNPGKAVRPNSRTGELRLGAGYKAPAPRTHFQFPDDEGSIGRATMRCVGVGQCRRLDGGTMCPSFMVTREEKDTTRGRAHLLFEMLRGDVITTGWKSEAVKDALDLCLACKGCKHDCPVNVDMATYKAEFLSHYFEGRLRPRSAYAFGLIYWTARAASHAPGLVNFVTQTPGLSSLAKGLSGMAPERTIPRFAPRTFTEWHREHPRQASSGPRVVLWPDTFNNHFFPGTLAAAAEVLEDAGCQVVLPRATLCCGRPLYDYGMLGLAKRQLRQIMHELGPEIDAGTPIVGLEPSCVSVFRDELVNLFPKEDRAKRLHDQVRTLGEYLTDGAHYTPPHFARHALMHAHCHHKSVIGTEGEAKLLHDMGIEVDSPATGCCGMAGSFGFEEGERYDVSQKVGERVLLPAVREAGRDTIIVADGFSCREQIAQGTDRRALHLAEVIQLALHQQAESTGAGERPEAVKATLEPRELSQPDTRKTIRLVALGAGLLGAGLLVRRIRKRSANGNGHADGQGTAITTELDHADEAARPH